VEEPGLALPQLLRMPPQEPHRLRPSSPQVDRAADDDGVVPFWTSEPRSIATSSTSPQPGAVQGRGSRAGRPWRRCFRLPQHCMHHDRLHASRQHGRRAIQSRGGRLVRARPSAGSRSNISWSSSGRDAGDDEVRSIIRACVTRRIRFRFHGPDSCLPVAFYCFRNPRLRRVLLAKISSSHLAPSA
jgi:hypothetical protein